MQYSPAACLRAFVSARAGRGAVQAVAPTIGRGALVAVTRMATLLSPVASRSVPQTVAATVAEVS